MAEDKDSVLSLRGEEDEVDSDYPDDDDDDMSQDDDDWPDDDDDEGDEAMFDDAFEDETVAPTFTVLTPEEIVASQVQEIERICSIFCIPGPTAQLLLQHFGWDANRLVDRYANGEADDIYREAHIANPHESTTTVSTTDEEVVCGICICEYPRAEVRELPCGHVFCAECLIAYLVDQIMHKGQAKLIGCPEQDCSLLLDQLTVTQLLAEIPDALALYRRRLAEAFVDDARDLAWCPAPECGNAIRMFDPAPKPVTCSCGHCFCFECRGPHHEPATCQMVRDWNTKHASESETANFLAVYTKNCPKCGVVIYKEDGCQYMTCVRCHHNFCWLCLGAFNHTDHRCNRYDPSLASKNSARAELHKFHHFSDRFTEHKRSKELEKKLVTVASQRMEDLRLLKNWRIDFCKFYAEAAAKLQEAREVLMNTYIYGFYLPAHVNRELFEFLQSDLESGCERLSQCLESKSNAWHDREHTINLTRNVDQRLRHLIDGLDLGEIEGGDGQEKLYYDPEKDVYKGFVWGKNLLDEEKK
eukprot:gnl/Trimastix_PCT/942.p1 GENE.gnl/Trimastix_PCT/942~~gnl/Trimastix_PCT/942.p1  ORF type:complete len:529 (-),score=161.91 gnl/Trimastix_PCT/942:36-1622(-)